MNDAPNVNSSFPIEPKASRFAFLDELAAVAYQNG